jgi:fatty acid CoA ligase FadD9
MLMLTTTRADRLRRRIQDLYATDSQFACARPDDEITAAASRPELRLSQVAQIVMEGYADRPALGQRAMELVNDPGTRRTVGELLPRFDTITYRELWDRAGAAATAMVNKPLRPGDRVCVLGYTSIDYTVTDLALIRLGAVSVPLHASAALAQLRRIVAHTRPSVIAASIDHLPKAVELALTAHTPTRLVVFDYFPGIDVQREVFDAGKSRLTDAHSIMIMESLAEVLARGRRLPVAPPAIPDETDPLRLLITAGGAGGATGARYSEHVVANFWRRTSGSVGPAATPSITLSPLPMSHAFGQHTLYGALGSGGTAYFAAKSDLSTLLEDLALTRPTDLNFVPRIWELLFAEFQRELNRRATEAVNETATAAAIMSELREKLVGGRCISAMTSSAPISAGLKQWVESFLDVHLAESRGPTEEGPYRSTGGCVDRP